MSQYRSDHRRHSTAGVLAAAILCLAAPGCRSGAASSKPSWWSLGGTGDEASKLASAPSFDESGSAAGVAKPSKLASPYPTTGTPDAYAIDTASPAGAAAAHLAAAPAASYPTTVDAQPIVYGQAPATPPAYPSTATASAGVPSTPVGPQAGPYAAFPAAPPTPASQLVEAAAATPPTQGLGAELPSATPTARMADARFGGSGTGATAAVPASDSRYGGATEGSRFSGGPSPGTAPAAVDRFPSAAAPTEPPLAPARAAALPSELPSAAGPLPPSEPSQLPASPRRRPDPGYRPGGTSSYRPSRSILVGEPMTDPAVRAAGFEMSTAPIRQ